MSKSKYKLGDKVMTISTALYPKTSYLMGVISKIHQAEDNAERRYDVHYGIVDIPDEKNIPESDIILWK